MNDFVTPAGFAESTYEVKKSRFIASATAAAERSEAMAFLQQVRSKYPDAGHHCWAYLLGNPATATSAAMNDDGEPSGTAGKPILNVLQHKGVGNVVVVVSRYFGGVKLGAGGLVRAYSTAAQQVMDTLPLQTHRVMESKILYCDFACEQLVRHWLAQHNGEVGALSYANRVCMEVHIPTDSVGKFEQFALANKCETRDSDPGAIG
ncbi:MAG: YigZ family protein [Porticoccaceae bacterium]|nr:YigZ family protein [Porticoccaceae bacterium]